MSRDISEVVADVRDGHLDVILGDEEFWRSTPAWRPETFRGSLNGNAVAWTTEDWVNLPEVAAVVSGYFDGQTPLSELAEDLAFAIGVESSTAELILAETARQLARRNALTGLYVPEEPSPASPEVSEVESAVPSDHSQPEVEHPRDVVRVTTRTATDGTVATVEHRRDGSWRISSTVSFGTGNSKDTAKRLLSGDLTLAEVAPEGSCLGSKLRIGEPVPTLSVKCRDHQIRSIRCDDPDSDERIRAHFGDRVVNGAESGPVVAFVVAPLEGNGPVRIYDGMGQRQGRPRSTLDVVTIVDGLIAAHREARSESPTEGLIPLPLTLLRRGDDTTLVPADYMSTSARARQLRSWGWTPEWSRFALDAECNLAMNSEVVSAIPWSGQAKIALVESMDSTSLLAETKLPSSDDLAILRVAAERVLEFYSSIHFAGIDRLVPSPEAIRSAAHPYRTGI